MASILLNFMYLLLCVASSFTFAFSDLPSHFLLDQMKLFSLA